MVIGASNDGVADQAKFARKFNLPFVLLADTDLKVAKAYGAAKEKSAARQTFLIDPKGNVAKVWRKVSPAGHEQEVLAAIR